ncbi:MAG TPA: Flp pilus assembly protein CpaB, partial [Thermomicrobiales bacterium]|nr:Flp pilus assembly protein CpaB [Thermomicrobiales bacterium]
MKRSNRLVILVGVLLAVLAFVAIVILLNNQTAQDPGEAEPTTVSVVVATQDIEIGDPVTPDVVEEQQIDPEAVIQTPLRSTTQVSGQRALLPIPAGSQVTAEAIGIGDPTRIDIAAQLEPGEKAVTFQVDRATGVDFLVKPGDSIDIVMSQQISVLQETADSIANDDPEAPARFETVTGLENQRTVKAVLQDKRVLYVSNTRATAPEPVDTNGDGVINEQDQQPAQAAVDSVVIVFAGTDQDAEVIKFAQQDLNELGLLTAVIRHADDDETEDTLGITIDQLVEEFGLRIPGIVEAPYCSSSSSPARSSTM